jgi:hypothetical protein
MYFGSVTTVTIDSLKKIAGPVVNTVQLKQQMKRLAAEILFWKI